MSNVYHHIKLLLELSFSCVRGYWISA